MAWTPDRRSLLLAAAAMALVGCAPDRQGSAASEPLGTTGTPQGGRPVVGTPESQVNPGAATAAPSVQPPSVPPPPERSAADYTRPGTVPARADITSTHAGHVPKYWGLEAPGVLTRLPSTAAGVALTFDFCGGTSGNGADLALLNYLRQQHIPATLFLNSRWITANQALVKDLAGDPLFELGNHGTSHSPLSVTGKSAYGIPGTRNPGEVYDEIMTNDARLTELTGRRPRFFRPGTAHLDEVSAAIVRSLGLIPVGFSVNGDAGATSPTATVTREISGARATDIIIAHGNHPTGGTAAGLMRAVTVMKDRGETFLPLPQTSTS